MMVFLVKVIIVAFTDYFLHNVMNKIIFLYIVCFMVYIYFEYFSICRFIFLDFF